MTQPFMHCTPTIPADAPLVPASGSALPLPPGGDEIVRIQVLHNKRRTSVSMDSRVWGLLMIQMKTHEAARDWVRATVSAMDVTPVRSPSLSRRVQAAIIQFTLSALQAQSADLRQEGG